MYTIGNNTVKSASFIDVGIHENIEVEGVRYAVSENGNKFIAISYVDENGNKLTKTEWEPKGQDVDAVAKKVASQMERFTQFLYTFIPDTTKFTATSFEDFANKFMLALGDRYKGVKIRLKVVYDRKNWTSTPDYGKYRWIEPMTISKDASKIRELTIDKFKKEALPKTEGTKNPDGLPF